MYWAGVRVGGWDVGACGVGVWRVMIGGGIGWIEDAWGGEIWVAKS